MCDGGPRPRCDDAAVQPHPVGDGSALQERHHHSRRQDRRERHPGVDAPPQPLLGHGRIARRSRRSQSDQGSGGHQHPGQHAACPGRCGQSWRAHPGTRRNRRAQPDQPASHPRRAVPAPLPDRRIARGTPRRRGVGVSTTLAPPRHARPEPVRGGSGFTGTFGLLRFQLRRDRIVAPLWVLLLSLPLAPVYIRSIEAVYPTAAQRAAVAASIMASPAQRALYGNVYNDSIGAVGIWKAGMFHTLIGVAVILTVIRHTRAEEESGRAELLDSTAGRRYASLTAALILTFGASIATGLIGTAGLFTTDVPRSGSLAFGLALAGSGLVFSAVAAVAAQLSTSARIARGIAFTVLGVAFALRAVGDASTGTLSWLSPLGWSLQVRPYAGDRWWVLLLYLITTVILTVLAALLRRGRDIGGGLISERPGPPAASAMLRGPFGLAWRLQRAMLVAWTIGLCLYGLLIGSVVNSVGATIGDSATMRDIGSRLGGSQALEEAFITIAFSILAVVAAASAVSSTLRLYQEETAQGAEASLAAAVSRT